MPKSSLMKTFGGKAYLSKWVVSNFPKNYTELEYYEPYCGGAAVFFEKKPSKYEVLTDIDERTIAVLRTVRDEPDKFVKILNELTYTQETFDWAISVKDCFTTGEPIELALNEFILRRMSRAGMKKTFAWSERLRGGKPGDVNSWENAIKAIPAFSKRLQDVTIVQTDAIRILTTHLEDSQILWYLDPPYLHSTRKSKSVYDFEMTELEHFELVKLLTSVQGKVILSGYDNDIYREVLKDWHIVQKGIVNHSGQTDKKEKRIECLWMNYSAA